MSRIGKKPISIPDNVEVKIEGSKVIAKGPKGELSLDINPEIKINISDKIINVSPQSLDFKGKRLEKVKSLWGLSRSLIANMIKGVSEGYEKKLELVGIGYRAVLEGKDLVLYVGFTHPVKVKAPEGINFSIDKNIITVSGCNKELVGQVAAQIRRVKKPEPYKGKGIRYLGEQIRMKAGKKAVGVGA